MYLLVKTDILIVLQFEIGHSSKKTEPIVH